MNPADPRTWRRPTAALLGIAVALVALVVADRNAVSHAQPVRPANCDLVDRADVIDSELRLEFTDADLMPGEPGTRLCVFFDQRWSSYIVWMLGPDSAEEFRRLKAQFQPLLSAVNVDACRVAFWDASDRAVSEDLSLNDHLDAGKPCRPQFFNHGLQGQFRQAEIEAAFNDTTAKAEEIFGWKLSWPLRVHTYDDETEFTAGLVREAGILAVRERDVFGLGGIAGVIAHGGYGYLINLRTFQEADALRALIAHEYAHVVQAGLIGSTRNLPFFATEGGAEYFAELVAGPNDKNLAGRFQQAVADERANRAVALRDLVARPEAGQPERRAAAYSRGYAAFRFLASRWGPEAFGRLHRESVNGTPATFVEALTRVTGLTLDEFDAQLRTYLLSQGMSAATVGRASLVEGSKLSSLVTLRRTPAGRVEESERFGRSDDIVAVAFEFACLTTAVRGEVRFTTPAGTRFTGFTGVSGPGCEKGAVAILALDRIVDGRSPRTQTGTWRAEVYADGVLQGSITFVID